MVRRRKNKTTRRSYRHGNYYDKDAARFSVERLAEELGSSNTGSTIADAVGEIAMTPVVEPEPAAPPLPAARETHRRRVRPTRESRKPRRPKVQPLGIGRLLIGTEAIEASKERLADLGITLDDPRDPARIQYVTQRIVQKYSTLPNCQALFDSFMRDENHRASISKNPQTLHLARFRILGREAFRIAYFDHLVFLNEVQPFLRHCETWAGMAEAPLSHQFLVQVGTLRTAEDADPAEIQDQLQGLRTWQNYNIPRDTTQCGPLEVLWPVPI